jgi:hypothetical protein
LVDDAFAMKKYVEVEGTMGTVEKISTAHAIAPPQHSIPFLTAKFWLVTNSRDWWIMKLRFTCALRQRP